MCRFYALGLSQGFRRQPAAESRGSAGIFRSQGVRASGPPLRCNASGAFIISQPYPT